MSDISREACEELAGDLEAVGRVYPATLIRALRARLNAAEGVMDALSESDCLHYAATVGGCAENARLSKEVGTMATCQICKALAAYHGGDGE